MRPRTFLIRRGYLSLLAVQFLGAANDNVLKQVLTFMVATGLWAGALGDGGQAIVGACLAVPFILFSAFAGQFADRHAKSRVILIVKIAEIPIVLVAGIGLLLGDLRLAILGFLLLATQSAFFGPAKYGVVPELVSDGDLPRANGVLNMMTNIAVIAGSVVAGPISDAYFPGDGTPPIRWIPLAVMLVVAVCGVLGALVMPRLAAQTPDLPFDRRFMASYASGLRDMSRGPLLAVAVAWAMFSLLGSIALLALPEYQQILQVPFRMISLLLGIMGLAVGLGSVLCGLFSGHRIRPVFVIPGGVGMAITFALLAIVPPTFTSVGVLIFLTGISAGFYIVPLQSLLQALSPDEERGRFLGMANGLSFAFILAASAIFYTCRQFLGMSATDVFLVCSALIIVTTGYAAWRIVPRVGRPG